MNQKTKYYGVMSMYPYDEITISDFNKVPKIFIVDEWGNWEKSDAYKYMIRKKTVWIYDMGDVLYGFGNDKVRVIEAIKKRYFETLDLTINDNTRRRKNGKGKDKQN